MMVYCEVLHSLQKYECGPVDIGLYLTLTDSLPLSEEARKAFSEQFPNPRELFSLCRNGRLPNRVIEAELDAQYRKLEAGIGRPPDFIDGHHHVHQFPMVNRIVCDFAAEKRRAGQPIYLRATRDSSFAILRRRVSILKSLFLSSLGNQLSRLAHLKGVPVTASFSGARNVQENNGFETEFPKMLRYHSPFGLIMCHPGRVDPLLIDRDPMTYARCDELDYISSSQFDSDLISAGVRLSRFESRY